VVPAYTHSRTHSLTGTVHKVAKHHHICDVRWGYNALGPSTGHSVQPPTFSCSSGVTNLNGIIERFKASLVVYEFCLQL
jgi:hypothetical protein